MHLARRLAGIWGPAAFTGAVVASARLQTGYSHRRLHISGLAALGERSALVMVPGFAALSASLLVAPMPTARLTLLSRLAGGTVLAAGLIPASQPRCPQPFFDPEAKPIDTGHSVASIATFGLWTSMPLLAARTVGPNWYRCASDALGKLAVAGCAAAAVTTTMDSTEKGTVQRSFVGTVFTWSAVTAVAGLLSRSNND